jgi:putative transposase
MQTIVLKLKLRLLNRKKAKRLLDLVDEYTNCVQFHLGFVLDLDSTNPTEIHRACYREARKRFSLPARMIQQARDKAIASYRSYLQRRKTDKRAKPPTFRKKLPVRLATGGFRLFPNQKMLRISTSEGFLWVPIIIPSCFSKEIKHPHCASEILYKGGSWYLMLAVKREDVPVPNNPQQPHFGLDLGLANTAVLAGPDYVKFFDGKPLRYVRGRYFRYRHKLFKKRKLGMVKRSKGRESNWVRDMNHKLSRQIVDTIARAGGILHVEKLTGIRERMKATRKVNRMLHSWPFAQLGEFIRYKAALAGVQIIEVDPRHTSQMCSKCGHVERGNRPKQSLFRCKQCGYEVHADLNASRNIAAKGASSLGVGTVTVPVNGEAPGRHGRTG